MALDAAGIATWDWDIVNATCAWAGAGDALLGEEPGTLDRGPGTFMERVHADDRSLVEAAVAEAVQHGRDLHVEHRDVADYRGGLHSDRGAVAGQLRTNTFTHLVS